MWGVPLAEALPVGFWSALAAMLGLALGSFAALVAERLPRRLQGQSLEGMVWPPSRCGHCGQRLLWWHNLPVLSHLWLRGRCGFCKTPFGHWSLIFELAFALLWGGMVALWGPTAMALAWASFFSVLWVLAVIDWRTGFLPDALTLPLCLGGLLAAGCGVLPGLSLWTAAVAAVLGYAILALPAALMARWRQQAVMGGGDPKLMGAIAAWLGLEALLPLLLCSSVLHVLWCWVSLRWTRRGATPFEEDDEVPTGAVPMGPALVLAAMLVWAWPVAAQPLEPRVFSESQANGVNLWAHNPSPAPATVQVVVEGPNVQWPPQWPGVWGVPGASQRALGLITPRDPAQPLEVRTRSLWRWGDVLGVPDGLPLHWMFGPGVIGRVSQAHDGALSTHASPDLMHALDVEVPVDTPLLAMRAGWVVQVQTGHTQGGQDAQLMERSNWVKVVHDDGTVATYAHLSPRPLAVQTGQRVEVGQLLGWTGNTGYSSGPHLHVCVSKPLMRAGVLQEACLPLRFAMGPGQAPWAPQEGLWVEDKGSQTLSVQRQAPGATARWAPTLARGEEAPTTHQQTTWWLGLGAVVALLAGVLALRRWAMG